MRILLTNDDGIYAPGIRALHQALQGLGEIMTIAPATTQSGTGHGITFQEPLMSEEVVVGEDMSGISVEGRPADCTKLAICALWEERFGPGSQPDLTISGMNMGANVGIHVLYSGTVGAAVESAFLGIPAIAVSLHLGGAKNAKYGRAAEFARGIIDRLLRYELDPHSVLNVNIPRTEREDAPEPELRVAPMNLSAGTERYDRRESPHGQVYHWLHGDGLEFRNTAPDSDVALLKQGFATVTPITYQMTDHARLDTWRDRLAP